MKKATLRRVHPRSAYKALVKPGPIVADAQSEWERGCKWAAFAIAITWGPMLALGIFWGW